MGRTSLKFLAIVNTHSHGYGKNHASPSTNGTTSHGATSSNGEILYIRELLSLQSNQSQPSLTGEGAAAVAVSLSPEELIISIRMPSQSVLDM